MEVAMIVTVDEIKDAPPHVREWMLNRLDAYLSRMLPTRDVPAKLQDDVGLKVFEEVVDETATEKESLEEVPSLDELMEVATKFLESNGSDSLRAVLSSLGISRVKQCPEDLRAKLLSEMIINA
jgi:hypothetical protein